MIVLSDKGCSHKSSRHAVYQCCFVILAVGEKSVEEAVVEENKEAVKPEEAKGKAVDNKKVPKHVREMQERLARMKEAEERRLRGTQSLVQLFLLYVVLEVPKIQSCCSGWMFIGPRTHRITIYQQFFEPNM